MLGLGLFGLALACRLSPLVGLIVKLFIDLFAVGDSFAKVLLFLSLLGLVLVLPAWSRGADFRRLTAILTLILLAFAVAQHAWVMDRLGLSIRNQIGMVHSGDFSTSRLDHIHIPKAALGLMLSDQSFEFDAGLPFQRFFPPALLWTQLFLLGLISLGTVLTLVHFREEKVPEEFGVSFLAWYIAVKACVDGGPLNSEFVAAIPFFLQSAFGGFWWRYAVLLWPCYLGLSTTLPGSQGLRLFHFGATLFTLAAVWLCLGHRRVLGAMALVAGVFLIPVGRNAIFPELRDSSNALNVLQVLARPLSRGEVLYVTRAGEFGASESVRIQEEKVIPPYRTARLEVLKPTRVYQVAQDLGLHVPRTPIRFPPQADLKVSTATWSPGRVRGDFQTTTFDWPAGATINYVVAQMPDGTAFRKFSVEETD